MPGHFLKYSGPEKPQSYNVAVTPLITLAKPLKTFLGTNARFFPLYSFSRTLTYHAGILYAPTSKVQLRAAFGWERKYYPYFKMNTYLGSLGMAWAIDSGS